MGTAKFGKLENLKPLGHLTNLADIPPGMSLEDFMKEWNTTNGVIIYPTIDPKSRFYKNCVRSRKRGAKKCQDCPFRNVIEEYERNTIPKTSYEWAKDYPYEILDPDGWDRENFQFSWFEEKITKWQFEQRVFKSTVQPKGF